MTWIKCMETDKEDEIVLWTNPKPSSTFSTQTVTLSDSIFNYSLIKITGRGMDTKSTLKWQTYVSPEYLTTCILSTSTAGPACLMACSINSSNGRFGRLVNAPSDGLHIGFGSAASLGTSYGSSNDCIIPEKIVGIK